MAAKHWSETPEKTNTAGISFLLAVFRLGGRTLFHLSLWPVIVFYWLASPTARRASRLYLDHVARTKNEPRPGCLATLKHIWRFADTILDKLLAVSGFFTAKDLAVEGVSELLADSRGAIIITAHTGCQELCQFIGETELEKSEATKDRLVYVLTHTTHAARFTEIVSKLNPKFAVRHLQVTDVGPQTAVQMSEIIEAGHWIVIVADRTPIGSSACVSVPFFGRRSPLGARPFSACHTFEMLGLEHDLRARNGSSKQSSLSRCFYSRLRRSYRASSQTLSNDFGHGQRLGTDAGNPTFKKSLRLVQLL